MDNINNEINKTYEYLKKEIEDASIKNEKNNCLEKVANLLMFMNRFRNCDLKNYFDEDIYNFVSNLNPKSKEKTTYNLVNKKEFKIAFLVIHMNDLGGASIPHRFMLKDFEWEGKKVINYFLITNFFKKEIPRGDSMDYLKNTIKPEKIDFIPKELSNIERGEYIQSWLTENKIDFVVAQTCPSTLYALSSGCVPIVGNLSQDCYTYTLGPGFGDITIFLKIVIPIH